MQTTTNGVPHGHSTQCIATMPKQAQTPPEQCMFTKVMSVQTLSSKELQYPLLKTNGQKRTNHQMQFIGVEVVAYGSSSNYLRDFTYVKIYSRLIRLLYIV